MKSSHALVLACLGALGAAAGIAAAAAVAVPPTIANLTASVPEMPTEITLADDAVTVTAPAGWVVRREPFDDDTLTLTSPDGRLEIAFSGVAAPFDTAYADLAATLGVSAVTPVTETLSSGARARHAEDPGANVVLAAVGDERGPVSAGVVARVTEAPVSEYRYAIAEVLDTVRVTP